MTNRTLPLLLLLLPALALAQDTGIELTVADTGVDGEALSGTPVTDPINMHKTTAANQLSLNLEVTPGTTTVVTVECFESNVTGGASGFGAITVCDTASPANCVPDKRRYTLADYTTVSGKKHIASRWALRKRWAQCRADDPNDGSGTVKITGTKSWQ